MFILRGLFIAAVASSALAAQGRGSGGSSQSAKPQAVKLKPAKSQDAKPALRVKYTDNDRRSDARVITGWYNAHPDQRAGGPGRGRARGHAIAPGWQKKLVRSAVVPVEYRTYIVPAPLSLRQLLPPVRTGWDFMVVENRVLLIDRPTWTIIDVVVP